MLAIRRHRPYNASVPEKEDIGLLRRVLALRLVLLVVLVSLFIVAAWGGWRLYGAYLADSLQAELAALASISAAQASRMPDAPSLRDVFASTARAARLENLFAVDMLGKCIADARPNVRPGTRYSPILLDPEAFSKAKAGEAALGPRQPLAGFAFRSAYAPIKGPDGEVHGVVVASAGEEFADVLARLSRAVRWSIVVAGLGLLVYIVLFWLGERHASRVQRQVDRGRGLALIGMLAAEVAHRIRNPMAIIMTTAETLRKRYKEKCGDDEVFDYIPDEVKRVDAAVKQLLALGRDETHGADNFTIGEAVKEAVEAAGIEKRFSKVEVLVESKGAGAARLVRGDKADLAEAFSNLMVNAAEAMEGAGSIRVLMEECMHDGARVVIQDNGPGMPKEVVSRQFDPFFTMRPNGTGLGLAIAARILEQHGARVNVKSGKDGTTFDIQFPAVKSAAKPSPPASLDGSKGSSNNG
jgi:signal transduction histidine kinase